MFLKNPNLKNTLLIIFILFFSTLTFSQTIWSEDFESYSDGTTTSSKWTLNTTSGINTGGDNYFQVRNNYFESRDTNAQEQIFETEDIDISGFTNIYLSLNLSRTGGSMEWGDYVNVYYILDGGAEIEFSTNGLNPDNFTNQVNPNSGITASQSGLNGSTVRIVVRVQNGYGNSERYGFDNIEVTGTPISGPEINITANDGTTISDGDNSPSIAESTDFGNVFYNGGSVTNTFTIQNLGTTNLDISSIISNNSVFTISNISTPTTISNGGSTTFDVTFSPTTINTHTATITVNNNDTNEAVYTFDIEGIGEDYCVSNGNNTDDEYISNVQLNTINNTSGAGTTSTGYSNFTSISTDLNLNSLYTITIEPTWTGTIYNEGYSVWIDYNADGDFSDPGEQIFTQAATNTTPISGSFTTPATAAIGTTRMRVSMKYNGIPTSCESFSWGEVEDYTINLIAACTTNLWTGAVSDDWNNALNWSCGEVPSITNNLDVLIPTGLTTYPVIYSTGNDGYANNIEFESGTSLIVVDNSIEIAGTLVLNGSIDLNGESQLIQTTTSTLDNTSTGYIEIDQQGTGNIYRYNYWSLPVIEQGTASGSSVSVSDVLLDGTTPSSPGPITYTSGYNGSTSPVTLSTVWMYIYIDSQNGYSDWVYVGSGGSINPAEGFSMKGTGAGVTQNYVFKGKPNNGTIELTVNNNNDYLVGNPYPSAIDADKFIDDNSPLGTGSITGTLYFWDHYGGDTHNLAGYQAGYATYTKLGGTLASAHPNVSGSGTAVKVPQRYIPVGQAFFVVGDSDGGQIQFNNSQRSFVPEGSSSIFMKSESKNNKNSEAADVRPKIRLGFKAPNIGYRQLLLTFDENTTHGVDWGYDGKIYEIFQDDMYWMIDNDKYVIQGVNTLELDKEFPLGIIMKENGLAIINIEQLENVDSSVEIYIKDNLTGLTHQINSQPFEINLEAGEYNDRFSIAFQPQEILTVAEDILEDGIHIFMNNSLNELQIKNNINAEILNITLYNNLGQQINAWNSKLNSNNISLPIKASTGIYFVQINAVKGKISKKIVIN